MRFRVLGEVGMGPEGRLLTEPYYVWWSTGPVFGYGFLGVESGRSLKDCPVGDWFEVSNMSKAFGYLYTDCSG